MRTLYVIAALFPLVAQAAFPLSCWTNRPETVVTVTGSLGASARISGSLNLWDVPLGQTTLNLSAPKSDTAISAISLSCKSPIVGVPGVKASKDEQEMYLDPSGKIPAGYSLPVPVWIDEPEPGFRRATIGGKP